MIAENAGKREFVQVEIDIKKLEFLLNQGHLCVSDLHCLNSDSKRCIWELCLSSCSKRMQCHFSGIEHYSDSEPQLTKIGCKQHTCHEFIKQEQIIKVT